MGQVCVKPKRSGRVKPGTAAAAASASSASYVSAASVQLELPTSAVEAYPDQTCTRISIAKTRSGTGKETLACDFFGGAGCFVCNVESIKDLLLSQSTMMTSADGTTKLPNHAIFDTIQTDGVCVKIFFEKQGKTENKHFTNEVASYAILKNITRQYFNLFTTYAEYIDPSGKPHTAFTVAFGQAFQVEIDGIPVKQLRCILLRQCNMDVRQLIRNHQAIDTLKLFYDVSCMLYMLHSYGYAHCDIKPENIVYCPNEPIPYKLIDFNLKKYSGLEEPVSYTGKYILPFLYQTVYTHQTMTNPEHATDYASYKDLYAETNPNFTDEEVHAFIFMDALNVLKEKSYAPHRNHQGFLIDMSNNAYDDPTIVNALETNDFKDLYYKSDEYAMAMILLEIYNIQIEYVYISYTANEWPRNIIDRLIDAKPYFKSLSADACDKYVRAAIARAARSQQSQRSRRRSGGAKRKTKPKHTKTPLKDTSKKSSH